MTLLDQSETIMIDNQIVNPDKLTLANLGKNYRFLYDFELDGSLANKAEFFIGWHNLAPAWAIAKAAEFKEVTYRIQTMEKTVYKTHNPDKVELASLGKGNRFLFEHELDGRFDGIIDVWMPTIKSWQYAKYPATKLNTYRVNYKIANLVLKESDHTAEGKLARHILQRVWVDPTGQSPSLTPEERNWILKHQKEGAEAPVVTLLKLANIYEAFKMSKVGIGMVTEWLQGKLTNHEIIKKYAGNTIRMYLNNGEALTPYEQEWLLNVCPTYNIAVSGLFENRNRIISALVKLAGWDGEYQKLLHTDVESMKKFVDNQHKRDWWDKYSKDAPVENRTNLGDCGPCTKPAPVAESWYSKRDRERKELLATAVSALEKAMA